MARQRSFSGRIAQEWQGLGSSAPRPEGRSDRSRRAGLAPALPGRSSTTAAAADDHWSAGLAEMPRQAIEALAANGGRTVPHVAWQPGRKRLRQNDRRSAGVMEDIDMAASVNGRARFGGCRGAGQVGAPCSMTRPPSVRTRTSGFIDAPDARPCAITSAENSASPADRRRRCHFRRVSCPRRAIANPSDATPRPRSPPNRCIGRTGCGREPAERRHNRAT